MHALPKEDLHVLSEAHDDDLAIRPLCPPVLDPQVEYIVQIILQRRRLSLLHLAGFDRRTGDHDMGKEQGGYQGAIFDVDGVLVASPHEQAWCETLRRLFDTEWSDIQSQTSYTPEGYTTAVYQEHVSGKPRMSGE